ncbi:MAG: SDR family NAD(P)-dependent oxidoreductase, partial [Candidatus Amoebophilus sp.]
NTEQPASLEFINKKQLSVISQPGTSSAIAIIGMACRFPGANTIEQLWDNLCAGKETITFFTKQELLQAGLDPTLVNQQNYIPAKGTIEQVEDFDHEFFGISEREAETLDPQQRLFLELAWIVLEQAGYANKCADSCIGVYAGSNSIPMYLFNHLLPHQEIINLLGEYQLTLNNLPDLLATRVAYKLGLTGPSITLQTACSTSLVAVIQACNSLLNRQCDLALAGGISISLPLAAGYLYEPGMINSPDGHCKAFDAQAAGTVPADGIGIVALKRLEEAIQDKDHIYAVIKGFAVNNDGAHKVGFAAPSIIGQSNAIIAAQKMAGVTAAEIGYVEAHGTATKLGDVIELAALKQAFIDINNQRNHCAIGSIKSNIGHTNTAAGIAGLIKATLALYHGKIPASLHVKQSNSELELEDSPFYVNTTLQDWDVSTGAKYAGVSSFGIGGTNAHVILESAPSILQAPISHKRDWHILPFSAKTTSSLAIVEQDARTYLQTLQELSLEQAAYAYQQTKFPFSQRSVIICHSTDDALHHLTHSPKSSNYYFQAEAVSTSQRRLVFLFPGQGSVNIAVGARLYQQEPTFRKEVDTCAGILQSYIGIDIKSIFQPGHAEESMLTKQAGIIQPLIFVLEYALAKLWISWNIRPDMMIGHSLGEYVAACLAGVFSLQQALYIVAMRGRLIQSLPAGSMLAIHTDAATLNTFLKRYTAVSLACVNSLQDFVVAGTEKDIQNLEDYCKQQGIAARHLTSTHAFHSSLLDPILSDFAKVFEHITLASPTVPYLSGLTGDFVDAKEVVTPGYWVKQLRYTVQFRPVLEKVLDGKQNIFLEVGPGQSLASLVKRQCQQQDQVFTSLPPSATNSDEEAWLLLTLGKLWCLGNPIDWAAFHLGQTYKKCILPAYPFNRKRCWIDPPALNTQQASLDKKAPIEKWAYLPSWQLKPILRCIEPTQLAASTQATRTYLVFVDNQGVTQQLIQALQAAHHLAIIVDIGNTFKQVDTYHYTVDPYQKADYIQLFSTLQAQALSIDTIIHAWSLNASATLFTSEIFLDAQYTGYYSILFILQACMALGQRSTALKILTQHIHAVTPEEQSLQIAHATLSTLSQVIAQELPQMDGQVIDIGLLPVDHTSIDLSCILEEIESTSPDKIVAYRNKQRYVPVYIPIFLNCNLPVTKQIHSSGVYLITGGLGHMGLRIARHLAEHYQGIKLLLISRSIFPNKKVWTTYLATQAKDNKTASQIRELLAIEALGAEVYVISVDISDATQLAYHINKAYTSFGKIWGVIHAAGLPVRSHDQHLASLKVADCMAHFQSKIIGLLHLEQVLEADPPDFWIVMSSLSTHLGGIGLSAYAAANAALDNFCRYQQQTSSSTWMCVNWDNWSFESLDQPLGISTEEGLHLFDTLFHYAFKTPVIISTYDLEVRRQPWFNPDRLVEQEEVYPTIDNELPSAGSVDIHQQVAASWKRYLGTAYVTSQDNFFELGGDSLLAVRLASQLSSIFKVSIFPHELLQNLTLDTQVTLIQNKIQATVCQPISLSSVKNEPTQLAETFPLSLAQRRLWFLEQLHPNTPWYNMPFAYEVTGELNIAALRDAFVQVIQRHASLRTQIKQLDGQALQCIIKEKEVGFILSFVGLSDEEEPTKKLKTQSRLKYQLETPFDLANQLPIRAELIQINKNEHILLICLHHIVSDGWSMEIFFRELAFYYAAYKHNSLDTLPQVTYQYIDFAQWQQQYLNEDQFKQQLAYWQHLKGAPSLLNLPTDRTRQSTFSYQGASYTIKTDKALLHKLKHIAKQHHTTLFTVLLAAYYAYLYRYTNQEVLVVGTPTANRHYPHVENIIGFFVNTLALRADCRATLTFSELIEQVKQRVLSGFEHQDVYLDQIIEVLGIERS